MKNFLLLECLLVLFIINLTNAQDLKNTGVEVSDKQIENLQHPNVKNESVLEKTCKSYQHFDSLNLTWGENIQNVKNKEYILEEKNDNYRYTSFIIKNPPEILKDAIIEISFFKLESLDKRFFPQKPTHIQCPEALSRIQIEFPIENATENTLKDCFCSIYSNQAASCRTTDNLLQLDYDDRELSLLPLMHFDPGPSGHYPKFEAVSAADCEKYISREEEKKDNVLPMDAKEEPLPINSAPSSMSKYPAYF